MSHEDNDSTLDLEACMAVAALLPKAVAAEVLASSTKAWATTLTALEGLEETALGEAGGTRFLETMLFHQAIALQGLFGKYAKKAHQAGSFPQFQAFADMAMKAQNQSRRTLATLAEIRNPKRVAFIRQLNAAVNQQVNNHRSAESQSWKVSDSDAPELLETLPSERLDTRTQSQTIRSDPHLEALGAQHWPENPRRKSPQQSKQPPARDARSARANPKRSARRNAQSGTGDLAKAQRSSQPPTTLG